MSKHLIQILLPLRDTNGQAFTAARYEEVRLSLVEKFGGMTFYRNAPAEGLWMSDRGAQSDTIVVAEVMSEHVDSEWWSDYRKILEGSFQQDEIVVREIEMRRL